MIGDRFPHRWPGFLRRPSLDGPSLERLQARRRGRVVAYAAATVPWYRSRWAEAGVAVEHGADLEAFRAIPVTTKPEVKRAGAALLSEAVPEARRIREVTSGSTGRPLELFKTADCLRLARLSKLRSYRANGYRLRETIAELNFEPSQPKFFHRLGIHRTVEIPYGASLSDQVAQLRDLRPEVLSGYPSRITEVVRYLRRKGIREVRPRIVFTQAEALTAPQRASIREWWGVEPTENCATQEFQYVAWECPSHEGLHVNADLLFVEIVSMDDPSRLVGPGEPGFVTITDFTNAAMPLVRYNIEDVAEWAESPCACGRGFPLLRAVSGRRMGLLHLPSGRRVPGDGVVSTVMSELGQVEHFRCVQRADGSLLVEVVPTDPGADLSEVIRTGFRLYGGPIEVEVRHVEAIPKTAAGKWLPFRSELEPDGTG